ncbi:hypothetical protein H4219_002298 [Mycoemilia scoparia]|uniref:PH domain-containing protein n=1 Tax=Mycoemilia scoparia TaxID=417184 RepID=A0A9W7ZY31_9FUNG|nr:hypothetical protein H4219_002298 [Mycoemilia scoparia]
MSSSNQHTYELPSLGFGSPMDPESFSGWLLKRSDTGLVRLWRRRWFVIDGHNLNYYHSENPSGLPAGTYDLREFHQVSADYNYKKQPFIVRLSRTKRPSLFQEAQSISRRYTANVGRGISTPNVSANGHNQDGEQAANLRFAAASEEDMHQWVNVITQIIVSIETRSLFSHNSQLDLFLPRIGPAFASSAYNSPSSSRKNSDSSDFEQVVATTQKQLHQTSPPQQQKQKLRKNRSIFSFDISASRFMSSPFNRNSMNHRHHSSIFNINTSNKTTSNRRNGVVVQSNQQQQQPPLPKSVSRFPGFNLSSTNLLTLPIILGNSRNNSSSTLVSSHMGNGTNDSHTNGSSGSSNVGGATISHNHHQAALAGTTTNLSHLAPLRMEDL